MSELVSRMELGSGRELIFLAPTGKWQMKLFLSYGFVVQTGIPGYFRLDIRTPACE
jgi:hypothetical protein